MPELGECRQGCKLPLRAPALSRGNPQDVRCLPIKEMTKYRRRRSRFAQVLWDDAGTATQQLLNIAVLKR